MSENILFLLLLSNLWATFINHGIMNLNFLKELRIQIIPQELSYL